MNSLIISVNRFLLAVFNAVGSALDPILSPLGTLALWCVAVGALLTVAYGKLSNQERIRTIKKNISGYANEAVLYRHDPFLTVKAQALLLVSGLKYFAGTLVPIGILFVPSLFFFSVLLNAYGYVSISALKEAQLEVQLLDSMDPLSVNSVQAVNIDHSPGVRVLDRKQVAYEVSALPNQVRKFSVGGLASGDVDLSPLFEERSAPIISSSWMDSLFWGTLQLPPAGVIAVTLDRPMTDYALFGATMPWWGWAVIFIFGAGLATAKACKITF